MSMDLKIQKNTAQINSNNSKLKEIKNKLAISVINTLQDKTITKNGTYLPDGNHCGFSSVFVNVAGADGGIDTSDANATPSDIVSGKTAYVNGVKITGTHTCSGGGSSNIIYDEANRQVTIDGIVYDLVVNASVIHTTDGGTLPLLPEDVMNKYWVITKSSSTITAYIADKGIGWFDDKVYPIDNNGQLLNSDYGVRFTTYKLVDGAWTNKSSTYSGSTFTYSVIATNSNIYEWSNSINITQNIKYAKNN